MSYQASRARAFSKRQGPTWLKSWVWNWEFRNGKWDYLEEGREPNPFYETMERLLVGGRLLDVACGTGVVRCFLAPEVLSRYVGVDISRAATRRAEERVVGRPSIPEGDSFVTGDITDPAVRAKVGSDFNLILFKECIYYVPVDDVPALLNSMSNLLAADGRILFQIHDRERWAAHVSAIRASLRVIEEMPSMDNKSVLLVAHPRIPGRSLK